MSKQKFKSIFNKSLGDEIDAILEPSQTQPELKIYTDISTPPPVQSGKKPIKAIGSKSFQSRINKNLLWSIGLFTLALVFFAGAGLNVFAENKKSEQEKKIDECRQLVTSAQLKGLAIRDTECDVELNWITVITTDQAEFTLQSVKDKITLQTSTLEHSTSKVQTTILSLQQDLQDLDVNLQNQKELVSPTLGTDLSKNLTILQDYAKVLTQVKAENLKNIASTVNDFNTLLTTNSTLSLKDEQDYISSYQKLDQTNQIKNYKELKNNLVKVQDKINGQNALGVADISKYKVFSPSEFQLLYQNFLYPKTGDNLNIPSITDNADADQHIIKLATSRGYQKRVGAIESGLIAVDGQRLQAEAKSSWEAMKLAAIKDGIQLGIISGYRSPSDQKTIFNQSFQSEAISRIGRAYTTDEIIAGNADDAINKVLDTSSIPGYSKHHTGYTMDVTDLTSGQHFTAFGNTPAYRWMSGNNYLNAKRFGFIPSYPAGGTNFGPNPEPWEFVWVGLGPVSK